MSDDERIAQINAVLPDRWDRSALKQGASVCLTLAVPFRLLGAVIGGDSGGLDVALFFAYLALFVVGAGCAAWVQRAGLPMNHALATAVGTGIFVEIMFIIVRFIRGTTIEWFAIAIAMSLIFLSGIIGGVLGSRLQAQGFKPSSQR